MRGDYAGVSLETQTHIINTQQTSDPLPLRLTVTEGDLENWATFYAARYDLALFHRNEILIKVYGDILVAIAKFDL